MSDQKIKSIAEFFRFTQRVKTGIGGFRTEATTIKASATSIKFLSARLGLMLK
jgi:hypothetical protein